MFVPWVLSKAKPELQAVPAPFTQGEDTSAPIPQEPQVFNRYYHMFASGELSDLIRKAAIELGFYIGAKADCEPLPKHISRGIEIIQDGWERSNYYIELRCWKN